MTCPELMIKLHVIQAEFGDCFILESRSGEKTATLLVDGGPHQTFNKHLKPTLQRLRLNGKIDLIVLSHIDNDHIIGLLDLLKEIKTQRETEDGKQRKFIECTQHNIRDDLKSLVKYIENNSKKNG